MSETVMRIRSRFGWERISIAYDVTTLDFGGEGSVHIRDRPVQFQSETGVGEFFQSLPSAAGPNS
jgi:small conductance mechanosensitive channel